MFPFEREPGQGMIKALLTVLPVDQIKISSLMFGMAILAELVFGATVQPLADLALFLDPAMALQAVLRHQLLIAAVAFRAILDSFKKRVRAMQVSGRELSLSHARQRKQCQCTESDSYHTHPYPVQIATPIWISMMRYMIIANGL